MKFDPDARTLRFADAHEAQLFHDQLSVLVRSAIVAAGRGITDDKQATEASREVLREFAAVVRALNALRKELERHPGGA